MFKVGNSWAALTLRETVDRKSEWGSRLGFALVWVWVACQTAWAWAAAADRGLWGILLSGVVWGRWAVPKGPTGFSKGLSWFKCYWRDSGAQWLDHHSGSLLEVTNPVIEKHSVTGQDIAVVPGFWSCPNTGGAPATKWVILTFYAVPFASGSASVMRHL